MSFWNSLNAVTFATWLSGLLAAVLTVSTFILSERKGTLTDKENATANSKRDSETEAAKERAAKAEEAAGKANESAATANERAANSELKTATAILELESMKRRDAPRVIMKNDAFRFIKKLESARKGSVIIMDTGATTESSDFYKQLFHLLHSAGYNVQDSGGGIRMGGAISGIQVNVGKEGRYPHARAMIDALKELPFEIKIEGEKNLQNTDKSLPEEPIFLIIGRKY